MISIFKQKNPANVLLLLVYALVLKFPLFLHPVAPVLHPEDNYLYRLILLGLDKIFYGSALAYSILAFLIVFAQATLFNRICNYSKLLPKPNYLPGMAYIMITSLLPEWGRFGAPLLVNSVMIWVWYQMIDLYGSQKASASIFSIGMWAGVVSLLYMPAMAFLLLVIFGLLIMRPFRVREILMGLLGFTFPYYFLFLVLYLTGHWSWKEIVPHIELKVPALPSIIWVTLGIIWLVLPFIIGGLYVQKNLSKMLIQIRKNWSLLLLYLIMSVLIILISRAATYENWIVMAPAFAAFHSAAYYYPSRRFLPNLLHWLIIIYILVGDYGGNYAF